MISLSNKYERIGAMPRGRKKLTTEQMIANKEEQVKKLQEEIASLKEKENKEAMQKLITVIQQKDLTVDKAVEIIQQSK